MGRTTPGRARVALRLLCALAALLVPAAASAGGWAQISVMNSGDFSGGVTAGTQEVQVQVLQHGKSPVSDATVSVVATLGDLRVEQPAAMEFRAVPDSGTSPYDRTGWPEGQEPVYVARLDLPQPGDWQVTVSAQHGLYIEQNPVQFLLPVTGMPAGAIAGAAESGNSAAAATGTPETEAAGTSGTAEAAGAPTQVLVAIAAALAVAAGAWVALRSRRRPA